MTASHQPLDPVGSSDDAFLEAIVGLAGVCRSVAAVVGDASGGGSHSGADSPSDPLLDAVLGLVSICHTAELIIAAARGELVETESTAAGWSRELLR